MGPELVIAGWFVSVVINKLADMLISHVKELGMKDKLTRLKKALPRIQAVLEAVEEGYIRDSNSKLEEWMWQLRDAVDEADDVLDELEYRFLEDEVKAGKKNKVSNTGSRFKEIMSRAIKRDPRLNRLKKSVKELDEVAAHVEVFLELVKYQDKKQKQKHKELMERRVAGSAVSTATGAVIGRDKDRDEIINLLKSDSFSISTGSHPTILPVVGMGGVGKTTLAQYVYNDKRVRDHFKLRIWVCVSELFDATVLIKKILENATHEKPLADDLATLQEMLMKHLELSERYLLVLDDVWNDNDDSSWEQLFGALRSGHAGSKVLITTRSAKIRDMMTGMMNTYPLVGLNDTYFLNFFMKCSFGDEDPCDHQKLRNIGVKIAKKLKGNPLAAKAVGGLLRGRLKDDKYWASILENVSSCFKDGNDVMPILNLSYMHLPPYLKGCFVYCSIFPPDHIFNKDDLIYMWMAVGLVQQSQNETPEDIGRSYLEELSKRCFFDVHKRENGDIECYTMHDLLHELAKSVSEGECLRIVGGSKLVRVPSTIRHLYVSTDSVDVIKEISELVHLRTLILFFTFSEGSDLTFSKELQKLTCLRVLSLSSVPAAPFTCFLTSLGDFIHLRYLDIRGTKAKRLPSSLDKLHHLQVFMPSDVFESDKRMSNLTNLRHIISRENPNIWGTPGIGKLTLLQEVHNFVIQKSNGNMLEELGDMKELREVRISDLHKIECAAKASAAKLREKEHLSILSLRGESSVPCYFSEEVLDGLEPHPNLKELTISRYGGSRSPAWIRDRRLADLQVIDLSDSRNWDPLPLLGRLPYLKTLHLHSMNAVTVIGQAFHQNGTTMFRQLQFLHISYMESLTEFSGAGIPLNQWFPRLRSLILSHCPLLKELPKQLCHSTTLQKLRINSCSGLKPTRVVEEQGFQRLVSLRVLELEACPKLLSSGILLPSSLEELTIKGCSLNRKSLSKCLGGGLTSLSLLQIGGGNSSSQEAGWLTSLPPETVLQQLTSLRELRIENFPWLTRLWGLHAFPSLLHLELNELSKVTSLPQLPATLGCLVVIKCRPELVSRCDEDGGPDWCNIAHIPNRIITHQWIPTPGR